MDELIIWFFKTIAFLRNTEPDAKKIRSLEVIKEREYALRGLRETLNDPDKRELLSEQYAEQSDELFMARFQLGEIKKLIDNDEIFPGDFREIIISIIEIKPEDIPAVCIEGESG